MDYFTRLKPSGGEEGLCLTLIISDMKYLNTQNSGSIKICEQDTCIEAKGKHADQITEALVNALYILSAAAGACLIYKAINN